MKEVVTVRDLRRRDTLGEPGMDQLLPDDREFEISGLSDGLYLWNRVLWPGLMFATCRIVISGLDGWSLRADMEFGLTCVTLDRMY